MADGGTSRRQSNITGVVADPGVAALAVTWAKAFALVCVGLAALLWGWSSTVKVVPNGGGWGATHNLITGEVCRGTNCKKTGASKPSSPSYSIPGGYDPTLVFPPEAETAG